MRVVGGKVLPDSFHFMLEMSNVGAIFREFGDCGFQIVDLVAEFGELGGGGIRRGRGLGGGEGARGSCDSSQGELSSSRAETW